MTGREAAGLIAKAERRTAIRPVERPLEGPELHAAMFAAVARILARRIVEANAPLPR